MSVRTLTVRSAAPVRICDNGGWTDTWFAGHGCVLNLAVSPCVEVEVRATPADTHPASSPARPAPIVIHARNFGPPYVRDPERPRGESQPLIEAAIDAIALPPDLACHIRVHSDVPPGASLGTSAATIVALLGALSRVAGRTWDAASVAAAAHRVETEQLGRQAGIQDQIAAAYGGASFIEMDAYPHARVTALPLDEALRVALDARLTLIYLGRAHESSAIHDRVIAELSDRGPHAPPLEALRRAARAARDALIARDLTAFGRALCENTTAQASLHPDLVSTDAWRLIAIARAHGALGWKVNGAGGDGGSLAILGDSGSADATRAMRDAIVAEHPSCRILPVRISPTGLRAWDDQVYKG